jgi:hypothetical protein
MFEYEDPLLGSNSHPLISLQIREEAIRYQLPIRMQHHELNLLINRITKRCVR